MITMYDTMGQGLVSREGTESGVTPQTVWIDLLNPTKEEDQLVEKQLGISIPTRAETREIEASNRLYQENGAHYMTAFIVYNMEAQLPSSATLTFVLAGNRLVTIRYSEPRAIPMFFAQAAKGDVPCDGATSILIGLIEAIIHRSADLVERMQDDVEKAAQAIFDIKGGQQTRGRRLDALLRSVGKEGEIISRAQESSFSLDRQLAYFANVIRDRPEAGQIGPRIQIAHRDVHSLTEHMRFLSERITFLLDATLGMINIEQNGIIKIFSVASVALMPPTLIASIYGMNFKHMPELEWLSGYPIAIVLMIISAVVPFAYFRRKGWF